LVAGLDVLFQNVAAFAHRVKREHRSSATSEETEALFIINCSSAGFG